MTTAEPQRAPAPGVDESDDHVTPLIHLHGVSRRFQVGENVVTALEDVTLNVGRGEFIVVLGPSGSGKTTLLNLIGALDQPTDGHIVIAGSDITSASRRALFAFRRHTVSFIFQTFNLFPELSALENVEFGADVAGRADREGIARGVLERVGLGERVAHFPHELSGGEQQRVAIARAVAKRPDVLLCDEPTGALDFETGVKVLEVLAHANRELGTTTVVITHNAAIAGMADRVIRMRSGGIVGIERNAQRRPPAELSW